MTRSLEFVFRKLRARGQTDGKLIWQIFVCNSADLDATSTPRNDQHCNVVPQVFHEIIFHLDTFYSTGAIFSRANNLRPSRMH